MKKLLIHNLSIQYSHYDHDAFLFDENAVFFAEPGDIVVSRRKISDTYLSFLKGIQCIRDGAHFIFSRGLSENHTHASIFKDASIIEDVVEKKKEYAQKGHRLTLDSFALTRYESEFADMLGVRFVGNHDNFYRFGNKSTFRSLAKKSGFLVPDGYEGREDVYDKAVAAAILFLKGASEIVVKQDEGVAGIGSIRVTKKDFIRNIRNPRLFFSTKRNIIPTRSSASVVEWWHGDVVFSPSIQIYIDEGGGVRICSIHNQLFYENKMTYRGCASSQWLPDDVRKSVLDNGTALGYVLSRYGYRGHLSFNTIVLHDGTLLFNEMNPRRVMSSYPFQIVQRCGGRDASVLWYVSLRIKKDNWRGKDIAYVLERLSHLLFSPGRKQGIIPYDYGLLRSTGSLSLLSIGTDAAEVEDFLSHALSI